MQLLLIPDATVAADALRQRLVAELTEGKRVLWLIPGGSNISMAVTVMTDIPAEITANLTVTLTDERHGDVGHADSNWFQLDQAGFDRKDATRIDVLTGADLETTAHDFDRRLSEQFQTNDIVIGQFGMGPDGHIAGILPGSPAADAAGLATGYITETYTRVTATFDAIRRCQAAYVVALGVAKRPALENLQTDVPLAIQPAQILKELPEAYVYNDQIGEQP